MKQRVQDSWMIARADNKQKSALWMEGAFLAGYTGFLFLYISHLSLWLDELIEITQTRTLNLGLILRNVTYNPGGVPLGYVIEAISLHLFGVSAVAARLPSLIFGAATCVIVLFMGRQLNLRYPLAGVAIFAAFPLTVRYSLEGRPYAQGLFFSACAGLLLIQIMKAPTRKRVRLLCLMTVLALYSQPYSFLTIGFQTLAGIRSRNWEGKRQTWGPAIALVVSLLLFLPWLFYARRQWVAGIAATVPSSGISFKTPLLIAKDLLGSGYIGSLSVALLCLIGLRSAASTRTKVFLLSSILGPIIGVVLLDAATGYFLAIRQMFFVLPAVAILSTMGLEALSIRWRPVVAWVFLAVILSIQVGAIVNWMNRPREDWSAAAHALRKVRPQYDCVIFAPPEIKEYFDIFEPGTSKSACSASQVSHASVVGLANSGAAKATSIGFSHRLTVLAGDPSVEILSRQ